MYVSSLIFFFVKQLDIKHRPLSNTDLLFAAIFLANVRKDLATENFLAVITFGILCVSCDQ